MDFAHVDALREHHVAWRILRAHNAPLVLSFLGSYFVDGNRGASPAAELISALDDVLHDLRLTAQDPDGGPRFPKGPKEYLEDWASDDAQFLRRFYPLGGDELHYEITPAFEQAYAFLATLEERQFVGTQSRLQTVVDLLRQIVHGTEERPEERLRELHRRREDLDREIARVEAGEITVMDATGVRERHHQLSTTARELLADFRQVEENFRALDRATRERIAQWRGSKGELLDELTRGRHDIASSDQGKSFQAFYEFLLSSRRQEELDQLLDRFARLDDVPADSRVLTVHHDWSEAAERTQRTVRQISEQLRRFLDDRVWFENRRVTELSRSIQQLALELRDNPPRLGLELEVPGIDITLPFERPLYHPPAEASVESHATVGDERPDDEVLFEQHVVDQARLVATLRSALPRGTSALLEEILEQAPLEQGVAELVTYLALDDDAFEMEFLDAEAHVDYDDTEGHRRTITMPSTRVSRR
ncbi:DUF3375 domain-containing protein [uncultured Tessaracoccus sp.]|uniref:DUF3375 domain-containing protein n=1 Tax=uncultured Tessaracoccus sp. TaxID=905023 RepID=UPI0025CE90EB|nr:DUF3375 domain-containing protein [uncultured Tessaracoccus sp.]